MSKRPRVKLYLISIPLSLFICLALSKPVSAHEGKQGKCKSKHSSARQNCSLESPHAWLGLQLMDLNPNRSVAQDVEAGALVVQVIEGGPAGAVGIKQGDIIIAFNNQPVASARQLTDLLAKLPVGTKAQLTLISNGKEENKILTLAEPNPALKQKYPAPQPQLRPGMFMEEMMNRTPLGQMREGRPTPGARFSPPTQEPIVIKEQGRDYLRLYLRYQEALGLTGEQVEELKDLARKQLKQRIRLNAEIEIAEIELEELLSEEGIDLNKAEQKIKQLEAARGEELLLQAKTLHQAQALLTKEQRARLKQLPLN